MMPSGLFQWMVGILVAVAIPIVGYVLSQLDDRDKRLEKQVEGLESKVRSSEEQSRRDHETLRTEVNNAVLNEAGHRIAADNELESRLTTQIQRVIDIVSIQHAELKSDLRVVRDDIRAMLLAHKE